MADTNIYKHFSFTYDPRLINLHAVVNCRVMGQIQGCYLHNILKI